jgi:crotonobetainyl-CoA:carnitine CoA-transferase CaiB-like acyl-CoA transferase
LRKCEAMVDGASLDGLKVVDLTTTFMGPYCTTLLAQLGAEVLKVESPEGDVARRAGDQRKSQMSPVFLNANRGKRSIALDLKDERARDVLLRIIAQSDVLVHNMRPDAAERLGLSYKDVCEINSRLLYCALCGFGSDGPYRDKAAYDDVIQAASGLAALQAGDSEPTYVRSTVVDKIVALFGLSAILASLHERDRSGIGQYIEVPMYETMVEFLLFEQQGGWIYDPPDGSPGYARTASPYRRPYPTSDGYIAVLVYTDAQWRSFFDIIGRAELADEPSYRTIAERTENVDELYALVEHELSKNSTQYWLQELERVGIPAAPVQSVCDLFSDPHLSAVKLFESVNHPTEGPLRQARMPARFSRSGMRSADVRPTPKLSEHTDAVLLELGYDQAQIDALHSAGVIGPAEAM